MGTYNFNVDNFCRQILKIYGNSSVMLEGWPLLEFCMIEILENQGSLSLSLSLSLSNTHTRKQRRHTSFPLVISAFPFALDFLYVLSEIYKILATSAVMESALW
jgi:hypothetical protein